MERIARIERWIGTGLGALILSAALAAGQAGATSYSTDASDLWWNPAESGWGVQMIQQDRTIFATMYVYAQSGQPEFYVAVLETTATAYLWTGTVYRTTGPWWGAAFNPALVNEVPVGTMSFQMLTVATAQLDYTISGVQVTKSVRRMAFANERIDGVYLGGAKQAAVSGPCVAAGPIEAGVSITHGGDSTVSATMIVGSASCTMTNGTYEQHGRFGFVWGNYSCANGETGTISLSEVTVTVDTLTFRYRFSGTGPGYTCTMEGDFAGVQN